ncbi:MAG: hypothetical protein UY98_C0035G0005 [Candidatus Kaiserbacteria bacterium GW2011_GWA2_58_9]|uniref:Endonuclease/exonuclease/phosphatase domain-containing protein n=1 Tax=Candidatus Kaiserbacteria bacterium GW2011_GWA2_58_9 TaxID=1618672 RepID=A0A0G2AWJ3_9BACT|nr:MAG: hypothetical protein UY98_C0035G0005 [Candidatus Kaiserbacteria bacterium GW2011_GWA2_58_9]
MELKVLSWNIWLDGDIDAVVGCINDADADIIGLQEVIPERPANVLKSLEKMGYMNVFSKVMESRNAGLDMGNAIFTKHKILEHKTHVLSDTERRLAEQAVINIGGKIFDVFNTHLLHTHQKYSPIQNMQIEKLISLLPRERTIAMGDFNATPDSDTIQKMSKVLVNTDPSNAPTWSVYPEGCKTCNPQSIDTRLDYIFVSKDLQAHSPVVMQSKASDHLPISAVIEG